MKFFDLFAGIGGFRLALEREGYECVGHCEIDKYANLLYTNYFNIKDTEVYFKDATEIVPERLPDFDILTAGFPCQSFSIAGKRRGFEDTRGTLFFEIARIAKVKRPTYLLLENVKGLLSHDKGRTFETILKTLDELGYDAEWQVLNSKDFGVPQNRERVFIVGHLRGRSRPKIFPVTETDKVYYRPPKITEEIHKNSHKEVVLTPTARQFALWNGSYAAESTRGYSSNKVVQVGYIGNSDCRANRVYSPEGVSITLCANGGGGGAKTGLYLIPEKMVSKDIKPSVRKNFIREYENIIKSDKPVYYCKCESGWQDNKVAIKESPTLRALNPFISVLDRNFRIRKLTPLECFRLQGFPDDIYHKAKELGISDTQLYKMTGNSITVQVAQTIARKIRNNAGGGVNELERLISKRKPFLRNRKRYFI